MLSGYLDPASGSAIIGAVAAGAAGAGVAAKTMMSKLRFRRRGEADGTEAPTTSEIVDDSLQ